MMYTSKFKYLIALALFVLFQISFISCSDDEPKLKPPPDEDEADLEKPEYEVSDFVWRAMNFFYFWQEDVDLLADSRYNNRNEYIKMIKENADAEDFFQKLQYERGTPQGDRFSWFIEDYIEQEKEFQGISKDHGMEFQLSYIDRRVNDNLLAIVQLVHKGSNAEQQKVKRGMYFTHVNDQVLDLTSYRNLLYGDSDSFTITLAKYNRDNQEFENTGTKITLTKQVDFAQNPIVSESIIERDNLKIGYLFYNQFVHDNTRHRELNALFGKFKEQNIDELIVDLRYNRGGSIATLFFVASAISGKGSGDVISKSFWNRKILNLVYDGKDYDTSYFLDNVPFSGIHEVEEVPINKLNLERVYFITSGQTASASEGLINNLKPYMTVVQVGTKTVGKNDASLTLYDLGNPTDPSRYWSRNNGTVNPNHKHAIQPIVSKEGNSNGFYQFDEGIKPDHEIEERVLSLGTIGGSSEPLLKRVLQEIVPSSQRYYDEVIDFEFEKFVAPEENTGVMIYDLNVPPLRKE